MAEASAETKSLTEAAVAPDASRFVLIVGNSADPGDWAAKWLLRSGLHSRAVESGDQALKVCLEARPQVAIVHTSVTLSDGRLLLEVLRSEPACRDIPVIALCANPRDAQQALDTGVSEVVRKPIDWNIVSRRAEAITRTASLQRELDQTRTALKASEAKASDAYRHLSQLSDTDPLTGLLNVVKFRELLARALCHTDELALFIVGLERFSLINDAMGRDKGDRVLAMVGQRLRECLVQPELHAPGCNSVLAACAAKMDSVRFGLFVPHNGEPEHLQTIRRVLTEALAEPIELDGQSVFLTVSIGGAVAPRDGASAPMIMQNSERAMLSVKKRGGGFDFYRETSGLSSARLLEMDRWLREAVDGGELKVAYQPLVNLWNNRIVGAEALLRWHREPYGNISPAEFIPVAERNGIVVQIGEFVIDTACRQLRAWIDAGHTDLRMAINLTLPELRRGNVIGNVEKALENYDLAPELLEFELSERGAIGNDQKVMRQLHQLKAIGVRLSLDDFGTGDTSIEYLKRLPIDVLKLDRSYIAGALENGVDAVICSALVGLARNMNLTVIAEGVESVEQYDLLRSWGCHLYQGYFCSPAVFADAFVKLLIEQDESTLREIRA